jgi:hypothetical protein
MALTLALARMTLALSEVTVPGRPSFGSKNRNRGEVTLSC